MKKALKKRKVLAVQTNAEFDAASFISGFQPRESVYVYAPRSFKYNTVSKTCVLQFCSTILEHWFNFPPVDCRWTAWFIRELIDYLGEEVLILDCAWEAGLHINQHVLCRGKNVVIKQEHIKAWSKTYLSKHHLCKTSHSQDRQRLVTINNWATSQLTLPLSVHSDYFRLLASMPPKSSKAYQNPSRAARPAKPLKANPDPSAARPDNSSKANPNPSTGPENSSKANPSGAENSSEPHLLSREELIKQLAQKEKELAEKDKVVKDLKYQLSKDQENDRLIPCPVGQAGCGEAFGGFNLELAMGLTKEHYLRLNRIVKLAAFQYLDVRQPFRRQSRDKIRCAKERAIKNAKVFREYSHAWPIDEFLKQFLSHFSATATKDIEDEKNSQEKPDREAIKKYIKACATIQGARLEVLRDEAGDGTAANDSGPVEVEMDNISCSLDDEENFNNVFNNAKDDEGCSNDKECSDNEDLAGKSKEHHQEDTTREKASKPALNSNSAESAKPQDSRTKTGRQKERHVSPSSTPKSKPPPRSIMKTPGSVTRKARKLKFVESESDQSDEEDKVLNSKVTAKAKANKGVKNTGKELLRSNSEIQNKNTALPAIGLTALPSPVQEEASTLKFHWPTAKSKAGRKPGSSKPEAHNEVEKENRAPAPEPLKASTQSDPNASKERTSKEKSKEIGSSTATLPRKFNGTVSKVVKSLQSIHEIKRMKRSAEAASLEAEELAKKKAKKNDGNNEVSQSTTIPPSEDATSEENTTSQAKATSQENATSKATSQPKATSQEKATSQPKATFQKNEIVLDGLDYLSIKSCPHQGCSKSDDPHHTIPPEDEIDISLKMIMKEYAVARAQFRLANNRNRLKAAQNMSFKSQLLCSHLYFRSKERLTSSLDAARSNGWPVAEIDYDQVANRIAELHVKHNFPMIFEGSGTDCARFETSLPWRRFVGLMLLKCETPKLSFLNQLDKRAPYCYNVASAGYYGPIVRSLIASYWTQLVVDGDLNYVTELLVDSTFDIGLYRLKSPVEQISGQEDALAAYSSEDAYRFWDEFTNLSESVRKSRAFNAESFFNMVMVPHVVNLLIMEDMNCAYDDADKIWRESASFGKLHHGHLDDNDEMNSVDNFLHQAPIEQVQPRCHTPQPSCPIPQTPLQAAGGSNSLQAMQAQAENQLTSKPPRLQRKTPCKPAFNSAYLYGELSTITEISTDDKNLPSKSNNTPNKNSSTTVNNETQTDPANPSTEPSTSPNARNGGVLADNLSKPVDEKAGKKRKRWAADPNEGEKENLVCPSEAYHLKKEERAEYAAATVCTDVGGSLSY
ncbi:hypothetical protein JR316_0012963 [Psilocybe cubensis]|uniref:Uncharacterized protein n=2 Tax=Psilocybe cubensis TaxID=181762 RepID=A0ACB8GFX5_PSICU|nr:hypothetical protein JR316_0012963 [Psilocybe cubensis]KAH9474503.1 hypothetical protein JR316_0012963 [Psilocybe cubensis]